MLPDPLQRILKKQVWKVNPKADSVYTSSFNRIMYIFEENKTFLGTCCHYTQDLTACITRTKADIQELQHIKKFMTITQLFNQDLFPFITVAQQPEPKPISLKELEKAEQERICSSSYL